MDEKNNSKEKRIRIDGSNYNDMGTYHLTLYTVDKACILSHIDMLTSEVILTDVGENLNYLFFQLNEKPQVKIENYVIMPNHIHILLTIINTQPFKYSQEFLVKQFAKLIKKYTNSLAGEKLWERGFVEEIIRSEEEFKKVYQLIEENPSQWTLDEYHP